ncbi:MULTISPECIES: C40 family peptidase [unclassified Bradyrhizobium]|uniref:C40 family peptidase n=1 Tax=unclassified Bradyrhizobium TaxID=2631580 RepID=UPI0028F07CFD|nr:MULTISPECIES: C40 family peptidase [unclassified Bradyrhizobium]
MADPRLTPARGDIAAKHLEGQVTAARFVEGEMLVVADSIAPLRQQPFSGAELATQALRGERVTIYDRNGEGWAWGQLAADGYVGWLPESALAAPAAASTHKISVLRSFAFPGPSIKLPPVETLLMGSTIAVTREEASFVVTAEGWFVPQQHVTSLDAIEHDYVAVAERFVGTPYLWGGKSSLGIDCSGLVQVALNAAGMECPRDSDMQLAALGRVLDDQERAQLRRGDLIFWKGHVAIVRDADTIVHANAFHMATRIEPTRGAIARIRAGGSDVLAIKRLD